jgi:hypothetical protein
MAILASRRNLKASLGATLNVIIKLCPSQTLLREGHLICKRKLMITLLLF